MKNTKKKIEALFEVISQIKKEGKKSPMSLKGYQKYVEKEK